MNNSSGPFGEKAASDYLTENGYRILERNYHSRFGEIDIIAENGQYIIFAEVKTREAFSLVGPEYAVTPGKQRKIAKTALLYLQKNKTLLQPRFDVIGIVTSGSGRSVVSLNHIKDAFCFSSFY
ncbi:hypothetical protein CAFE_36770 [Caprobacter fermentans]|uniref:UPF0102 protein CAFE_36770 n=1 Tax=Caproicibacter fermentans TaxID=2576756 RepID=A0A6N8I5R3_9FIRM|nr:YraN family protein [Caproicibacter fermentans]MVB12930.1 hypothetical protein [Caproicibacter fermentans]OCN02408.1 hypothetical protein A7X67_14910 [Clostridium sp. W14A]QNK41324.1 YraN family protein [Caproicibacter fermentans]